MYICTYICICIYIYIGVVRQREELHLHRPNLRRIEGVNQILILILLTVIILLIGTGIAWGSLRRCCPRVNPRG